MIVKKVIIMRIKRFINDPNELLAQGQILVKENMDIKFAYRVSMVNLILSEMSVKDLSAYCGDGETTLLSWVTKVDRFGWDALRAKKQPGRPNKLSEDQIALVKVAVTDDPDNYGFKVWDGPSLSKYIKDAFNIDLGVRACQKLLHKMGFALIRPQMYPSLGNPDNDARDAFKKSNAN